MTAGAVTTRPPASNPGSPDLFVPAARR
jgi:hypothetical protein